jgi:hypothetical protein
MDWLRLIAQKVLSITHGRTTAFFISFFISGHVMAWFGKLNPSYVAFMASLGTLVVGHSFKEDWAEKVNGPRPPAGPDPLPGGKDDGKS